MKDEHLIEFLLEYTNSTCNLPGIADVIREFPKCSQILECPFALGWISNVRCWYYDRKIERVIGDEIHQARHGLDFINAEVLTDVVETGHPFQR